LIEIAILGVGEIFGQEEMFFDYSTKFTATTLSEVHLFQIPKEVFFYFLFSF
jgi:CRP-like cAMP-binding protein